MELAYYLPFSLRWTSNNFKQKENYIIIDALVSLTDWLIDVSKFWHTSRSAADFTKLIDTNLFYKSNYKKFNGI